MIKRSLLVALGLLALGDPLSAQGVNTVPQVGVISAYQKQYSYSATAVSLVPASAATDLMCIAGSPSRNIAIKKIEISGTAGTAITTPFLIYRRATLDTGGTPATGLALPVAAKMNPGDPASIATLVSYTANPTVTDSSPVLLDSILPALAVTTTANNGTTYGEYAERISPFFHSIVLQKNTTQQICINLNGATVATGVLQLSIYWIEQ